MPASLKPTPMQGGQPSEKSPGVAGETPVPPRRRPRLLIVLLVVLVGLWGLFLLRDAWQKTALREAYLPQLQLLAQRAPFNGSLLVALAGRQAQSGDYASAADTFQRAIAAGEDQPDVWLAWAAADAANGHRTDAEAVLELGRRRAHTPSDAATLEAALARSNDVAPNAIAPAIAQAICPSGVEPILAKRLPGSFLNGLFAWWGRLHPEQSGFVTRQLQAQERPNDAVAQRWWALALIQNRRLPAAETVLRHAVSLAPDDPEAHLALADLLRQEGSEAKAGREYEQCLKLRHDWLPALLGLGQVALDKSLIALSVSVFQKATAVAPHSAEAFIGMGHAYYNTHIQLGQAVSAYQQAERLAPNRTDFYPDYFRALRMTFQYDKAEALIRRRLQAAPHDSQSHFLLALLLKDYKPTPAREAEAEQELRTALRLTPGSVSTEVELAQVLLERNKADEAIGLLNDVLRQDDLNVKAIRMLERAYRQAGQPALADQFQRHALGQVQLAQQLGDLQDAEHRAPADLKVHSQLAGLYARLGRTAEAAQEQQYVSFLRLHPDAARRGIEALDAATTISHPVLKP